MSSVGGEASEPTGGLPRILFKLRTQGPRWIGRRLAAEAVYPTTGPGQVIHALARRGIKAAMGVSRMMQRRHFPAYPAAEKTLFAFYDLKVGAITFDCLWFLAGADLQRRRLGLDRVHVVIVPGPQGGLRQERDDYEAVIDPANRAERIHNILIQACALLPSWGGLTQAGSREEAAFLRSVVARHVFPLDYEPALPVFPSSRFCLEAARRGEHAIATLRATPERLRNVDSWLATQAIGERRLVTITLRGYAYMPARNSNVEAWAAFARKLDPDRYFVVFIPDTDETVEGLPAALDGCRLMPEAAWNVGLRMALYQRAFVNLGVNTGPMGLCWLNATTRYATLKMMTPGVPQTTPASFRHLGFELGRSLPFATPFQELVWEDDTHPVIERVFARLVARIESSGDAPADSGE